MVTYIPIALIGIMLYLTLSIKIKMNRYIEYIGKNSLVFLAFQEPVYRAIIFVFSKVFNHEIEFLRNNLLYSFIITIVSISTIIPAIYLYNRYIRERINSIL